MRRALPGEIPELLIINIRSTTTKAYPTLHATNPDFAAATTPTIETIARDALRAYPLYPLKEVDDEDDEDNDGWDRSLGGTHDSARGPVSPYLPVTFVNDPSQPLLKLRMSSLRGYEFVVPYHSLRLKGKKRNERYFIKNETFNLPARLLRALPRLDPSLLLDENDDDDDASAMERHEKTRVLQTVEAVTRGLQTLVDLPESFQALDELVRDDRLTVAEILLALWVAQTLGCEGIEILLKYESYLARQGWFVWVCCGSCDCISPEQDFYRDCKRDRRNMARRGPRGVVATPRGAPTAHSTRR